MGVSAATPAELGAYERDEITSVRALGDATSRLATALDALAASSPWGLPPATWSQLTRELRHHVALADAIAHEVGDVGRAFTEADQPEPGFDERAAEAYIAAATGRLSPAAAAEYARAGHLSPGTVYIHAARARLVAEQQARIEALARAFTAWADSMLTVWDAVSLATGIGSLAKLAGTTAARRIAAMRAARAAIPHGFASADDFAAFGQELTAGLRSAGYSDAKAVIQGSSVTGRSFRTGEAFDLGRLSDLDVAIASPTALARAKALGIGLRSRGTRTGPLELDQLGTLGLSDLARALSTRVGRDVNFMLFDSVETALARGPSILVP